MNNSSCFGLVQKYNYAFDYQLQKKKLLNKQNNIVEII